MRLTEYSLCMAMLIDSAPSKREPFTNFTKNGLTSTMVSPFVSAARITVTNPYPSMHLSYGCSIFNAECSLEGIGNFRMDIRINAIRIILNIHNIQIMFYWTTSSCGFTLGGTDRERGVSQALSVCPPSTIKSWPVT